MRTLGLIGAPSSAGAYAPGQEKAPETFRRHGLVAALSHAGRQVSDRGDIAAFRWRPDPARPKAMNLDAAQRTAQDVATRVATYIEYACKACKHQGRKDIRTPGEGKLPWRVDWPARWGFLEVALKAASEPVLVTGERICPTDDDYPLEVISIKGQETLLLRPEHLPGMQAPRVGSLAI